MLNLSIMLSTSSGDQFAEDFVIDRNYRRKPACSDASACIKRESAVFRTFADVDGKPCLEFVKDIIGSFDIACSSHAYVDLVFCL